MPVPLHGGTRGHLLLCRDVTERAAAEAQRRRILEQEREVRHAVQQQHDALLELAAMKNEFIASVSHELRTPITTILSYAGLLADDAALLPDDDGEFVTVIERNARRLVRLVDDLLFLAKLESRNLSLDLDDVDVVAVVEDVASAALPAAEQRGIELAVACEPGPALRADAGRVEQVLTNLVSNAVKFTPRRGRIDVVARHEGGRWTVAVTDTGIGIPAAERDRLFHRFYRGTNAVSGAMPGTGLGLAITRAIVELHGGRIDLESAEGVGTTVTVVLPDEGPAW